MVALPEPPCPEPAVDEDPVEVVVCADPDPEPVVEEPELDVWVVAWPPPDEPEPVEDEPEVEFWVWADEPFEPVPPADDDPDELVVVDAVFDELPEDDGVVGLEVPVVEEPEPEPELGAVGHDPAGPEDEPDGLVVVAPVFVCVFDDEPPPEAEDALAVLVFAVDEPGDVVVDVCVEVVVFAWPPEDGDAAGLWEGVVDVGVVDVGVVDVVVV